MALCNSVLDSLSLNKTNCINYIIDKIKCDFCIKECPYQAIYFDKNKPIVNFDRCTNCGICQQVCPHEVFTFTLEENHFYNNTYVFICKKNLPKEEIDLKPCHCLYNLSFDNLLLRLINHETIYFIVDKKKCLSCHGFQEMYFYSRIKTFFSYFEIPLPNIKFISYNNFIKLNLKKKSLNAQKRRNFITDTLKKSFNLSLDYAAKQTNIAMLQEDNHCLADLKISKKWIGLKILAKKYPLKDKDKPLPFYSLKIFDCDFCGHCVRNCSTNALAIKNKNGKYLLFNPTLCENCNICLYSCPKEGISYSYPIKAEYLTKKLILILYKSNEL